MNKQDIAQCLAMMPLPQVPGVPDMERGRALYENHCQVCHTPRVHSRANSLPINRAELREIVDRWQREEHLRWSAQDVTDVVEFLGAGRATVTRRRNRALLLQVRQP